MPTWRTELPPEGKHHGLDLLRTPTSGSLLGIITCDNLVVCDTHFWHGRTLPCERTLNDEGKTIDDTHCEACVQKAPWRTHVYVSTFDAKKRLHFIFECTNLAAKPLAEYRQATGTLRGCVLNASRPKNQKNAKVVILTNTANLARCPIPNEPDIPAALAVIWRLPRAAITETPTQTKPKRLRADPSRLHAMRNQDDNAADPPTIGDILAGNGQLQPQQATQ